MNSIMELREQLRNLYTKYTRSITLGLRFLMNLVIFGLIQMKLGFMPELSNGIITIALSVISTILPPVCTVIVAAVVVLLQVYALSIGILATVAGVFLLVFIFYLRFAPDKSIALMLTVVACALQVPALAPIIAGLIGGPIYILPLAFGTVVYYILHSAVQTSQALAQGASLLEVLTGFAKSAFQSKEMIIAVVAVVLGMLVVYFVRKMGFNHCWYAAIASGAVVTTGMMMLGGSGLSSGTLMLNCLLSVVIGLAVQFMIFDVNYSKTEYVEFEDDEHYYYVKAVPKNLPKSYYEEKEKRQHREAKKRSK